jgi:hypothetical protein
MLYCHDSLAQIKSDALYYKYYANLQAYCIPVNLNTSQVLWPVNNIIIAHLIKNKFSVSCPVLNISYLTKFKKFKAESQNTCCTQRMSNCYCTPIDIDLLQIKLQLLTTIYKLGSKCLDEE